MRECGPDLVLQRAVNGSDTDAVGTTHTYRLNRGMAACGTAFHAVALAMDGHNPCPHWSRRARPRAPCGGSRCPMPSCASSSDPEPSTCRGHVFDLSRRRGATSSTPQCDGGGPERQIAHDGRIPGVPSPPEPGRGPSLPNHDHGTVNHHSWLFRTGH
jgi:hypothetical protein